jgi:hypothetical protein
MATALVTATDAVGSEIWAFLPQIRDPQHHRLFERLALSLAIHTIHIYKFSAEVIGINQWISMDIKLGLIFKG